MQVQDKDVNEMFCSQPVSKTNLATCWQLLYLTDPQG